VDERYFKTMLDLKFKNRVALTYTKNIISGFNTKIIIWDVEKRKKCYEISKNEKLQLLKLW